MGRLLSIDYVRLRMGIAVTATYAYDRDGRITADTSRGITAIRYNPDGRPAAIDT